MLSILKLYFDNQTSINIYIFQSIIKYINPNIKKISKKSAYKCKLLSNQIKKNCIN